MAVAERIRATGARYVVVKGGHLSESADDVVAGPDGVFVLPGTTGGHRQRPRHRLLASRPPWPRTWPGASAVPDAIAEAKAFVARALAGGAGWHLGAGHGPLDHFGWSGPP